MSDPEMNESGQPSLIGKFIDFFLKNPLMAWLLMVILTAWGISVAPFDWRFDFFPRNPVPVDAIPNLGENQQIVATDWPGRSPQDVEDQVTYPLTTALMGVPGVKEVRSTSMFGFSMIFLIFDEDIEFYWSRARIIEKLNSLPPGLLPEDTAPALGPDATALGQIFWYTLEGRDPSGRPVGGWDLDEVRSIQDWYVRYGLLSAEGIAEVASIGGFVREYHVEVDPDALRLNDVSLEQVMAAVEKSNKDVGAGVTEINRVEYFIRGRGLIRSLEDIEQAVVRIGPRRQPIRVADVAEVRLGPADRRGALTVGGAEAVGAVVVVREGYNPLTAIQNVKARIKEIEPGLPAKAVIDWTGTDRARVEAFSAAMGFSAFSGTGLNQDGWVAWLSSVPPEAWPEWITLSRLTVVPFYDRTGLIQETLGTLNDALIQQVLVTVIVVLIMIMHLRSSIVISAMLPLAILGGFIGMKLAGVDANIVSLAGIAIAIGTIVDMGMILTENVLRHLKEAPPDENRLQVVSRGAREVGSSVVTAISSTVISFLPVLTMTGAEGKMFTPLAWTKTFVLIASAVIALVIVPSMIYLLIARRAQLARMRSVFFAGLGIVAVLAMTAAFVLGWNMVAPAAVFLLGAAVFQLLRAKMPPMLVLLAPKVVSIAAALLVAVILAGIWEPLGAGRAQTENTIFVVLLIGFLLGAFYLVKHFYPLLLRWCLDHKFIFLAFPALLLLAGLTVWLGFGRVFNFIPAGIDRLGGDGSKIILSVPWVWAAHEFPGLGREFMPALDEGAFLWMPTTMPHASIGEALDILEYQDMAIASVPEVSEVIGKIGRAETALDPAPLSMIETVILYKSEYITDAAGRRISFRYDNLREEFVRDENGGLIPDRRGRPFRQWRDHIRSPQDIWDEIAAAANLPGTTSAPKLQPIETRLVMLQTGMRAPMGIKLQAPDLDTLDRAALELERILREVPAVRSETVNAERVVGKPYLEIAVDRRAIARYGLNVADVQQVIAAAVGGMVMTTTIEGRERYNVRVRYQRELRNTIEDIERILVAAMDGAQVPLGEVADITYVRGPQMIRSENTFLTSYITFGGRTGMAEVDVVEAARAALAARVEAGELAVPPGVSWRFSGTYEHQVRATATLRVVLPLSLAIILLILYLHFRSLFTALIIFTGIAVAWAGGFTMIHLIGKEWFADIVIFGANLREIFQLQPINLSVAVWVGFLALFGIADDDGVLMATYLTQRFRSARPGSIAGIRAEAVAAGTLRVRPALMTTATTILALLPVLTSTGRGSDIMIPMAIPTIGGMTLAMLTMFTVPVLFCLREELRFKRAETRTQ
ncbi:MAG TPA: efflux RND transporter permease subunit [Acidobacteriota bacterium]|nr:efflux RND transporter permease subunit [Acidobacteriota bacterium]